MSLVAPHSSSSVKRTPLILQSREVLGNPKRSEPDTPLEGCVQPEKRSWSLPSEGAMATRLRA